MEKVGKDVRYVGRLQQLVLTDPQNGQRHTEYGTNTYLKQKQTFKYYEYVKVDIAECCLSVSPRIDHAVSAKVGIP